MINIICLTDAVKILSFENLKKFCYNIICKINKKLTNKYYKVFSIIAICKSIRLY